jgi:hypothetical protein
MSLAEYNVTEVTDFKGPRLRLDLTDVSPEDAVISRNVEYEAGHIKTRYGFAPVFNPNELISSMYNWVKGADSVSTAGNYLLYGSVATGKARYVPNLASPSAVDLFTQSGAYGFSYASSGSRLFIAPWNSSGNAAGQVRVCSVIGSSFVADTAFSAPMANALSAAEGGAGYCTEGLHRVAYYIQTRSGFRGRLAPVIAGTFTPSFASVAANKGLDVSINATWPADAESVWFCMTTASNLNRWYQVPGATASVTGGATSTVSVTLSISDDDLASTATEVSDFMLWLTQASGGTGPFNVVDVAELGNRIGYIAVYGGVYTLFASEPEQHQQITGDQHGITLPGFRKMTKAFALNGSVYIVGPHWTYSTHDTGARPVEWPSPQLVDARIGTFCPNGVDVNPSRGIAWVVDQGGLYAFDGKYASEPISRDVENDWNRINWAYSHMITVKDAKDQNRVYVSAPIDGATAPNAIFVFDYSFGMTASKVRYSFWTIDNVYSGGMEMVLNPTSKHRELWIGNAFAGKVYRQCNGTEAQPYRDDAAAINWEYETGAFPPGGGKRQHHAFQLYAVGAGTLTVTPRSLRHTKTAGAKTLTLAATTEEPFTKRFYVTCPHLTYHFAGATIDQYAIISRLQHYWVPWMTH